METPLLYSLHEALIKRNAKRGGVGAVLNVQDVNDVNLKEELLAHGKRQTRVGRDATQWSKMRRLARHLHRMCVTKAPDGAYRYSQLLTKAICAWDMLWRVHGGESGMSVRGSQVVIRSI